MTLLEVCVDSEEEAVAAINSNVQRIELCSHLELDGLTPDLALLKLLAQKIASKKSTCITVIHVMIRPRAGNFIYSDQEVQIMKQQIFLVKDIYQQYPDIVKGIVFGCLVPASNDTSIFNIATEQTIELCNAAKPELSVTFHRAFDVAASLGNGTIVNLEQAKQALSQIIKVNNIDRILTNGGGTGPAHLNLPILKELVNMAKLANVIIMPGGTSRSYFVLVLLTKVLKCTGGVRSWNFEEIVAMTGAQEIHSSTAFPTTSS